ncbi:MAG: hypothetical protein OHK0024_27400 [Thalassobaculales bacterium]
MQGADATGMSRDGVDAPAEDFAATLAKIGDAADAPAARSEAAAGGSGPAASQQSAQSQHSQAAGAAGQRPPGSPMPVSEQIAVQVHKAAAGESDRITIHLRPDSLGRVEVELSVDDGGRLQAVIQADRQDTLDLLRRDQKELERALQDAGLKADSGSLSFNLRGENQQQGRQQFAGGDDRSGTAGTAGTAATGSTETAPPPRRVNVGLVDVSV